jgi:hypothetical protein
MQFIDPRLVTPKLRYAIVSANEIVVARFFSARNNQQLEIVRYGFK